MKYRKKPVVIEATQWCKNGDHPLDNVMRPFEDTGATPTEPREGAVVRYFRRPDIDGESICSECGYTFHIHGWIDTKEGGHRVCPGDWIITGIKCEHYPCKPDIFAATYEPVAEHEGELTGGEMSQAPDVIGAIGIVPLPTLADAIICIAKQIEMDATEEAAQEGIVLREATHELAVAQSRITLLVSDLRSCLAAALKAKEEAERDARRYRWLNANDNFLVYIDGRPVRLKCGELLDRWIDASISGDKP